MFRAISQMHKKNKKRKKQNAQHPTKSRPYTIPAPFQSQTQTQAHNPIPSMAQQSTRCNALQLRAGIVVGWFVGVR